MTEIGMNTSLRYAIQMITTSSLLAMRCKSTEVDLVDIRRAYSMFLDVRRSSEYLKDHQKEYMFSEEEEVEKMEVE